MTSMDPALKRRFIQCLDQVKENYRKADGELDKPQAVGGALALMAKECPEERAWWDTLSPHAFGEVVAGEFARRRRKHIRDGVEANHHQAHPQQSSQDLSEEAHTQFDPSPAELEAEYDKLNRTKRAAEAALPGFETQLDEARERLAEAQRSIHRENYQALTSACEKLNERADKIAGDLADVLLEQEHQNSAMAQELARFEPDAAARLTGVVNPGALFLRRKFSQWLERF
jgi:hypothetical protein